MSPTRNQTFVFVNGEFVIIVLEQGRLPSLYSHCCCVYCLSCCLSFLLLLYGPHICCSSRGIIFQFSFHLACSLHCASLSLALHFGVRRESSFQWLIGITVDLSFTDVWSHYLRTFKGSEPIVSASASRQVYSHRL